MINPFVLLLLGFILGVLTGFFGVGGGFLLTPALNILGLSMVYAIGTGFITLVGKTLFGAVKHHKLGNVDLKLGITMGLFSSAGVELGKRVVLYLEKLNLAGPYVRVAYIILLVLISILMLKEYYGHRKRNQKGQQRGTAEMQQGNLTLTRYIYRIGLPPKISLPHSGVGSISLWVIIASGILIGFISGFMGLGGGFIGLPLLIYVIGIPTITAVGTSLVIVFITSCYGTIVYAAAGRVEWFEALIILAGSLIGVQLGVYATKYVTGMKIKVLFALLLFVVAVSVFLKQINMVTMSSYLVIGSACALCLAILLPMRKSLLPRNFFSGKT
ncbi:MAG: sulfite exporter TauE/SafE family protein [Deltaproteobacteria bacterium]|nr:MAG: sulfite exporter TauE/SafE family protein [Deltaproteobacteria bacterium]